MPIQLQPSRLHLLITLFWGLACGYSGYAAAKPFSNSFFAEVAGLQLHYRIWEPVVGQVQGQCLLVHGFGGSTFSWEGVADSLKQVGYRVVAVDVPPFGFSDKQPRQNQSVTARAWLLHQFLQQEFPGQGWHLAGHSMGGAIVLAMALHDPAPFKSLHLVNASLFYRLAPGPKHYRGPWRVSGLSILAGPLAESWLITPRRVRMLLQSAYGEVPQDFQVEGYFLALNQPGLARAILNNPRYTQELFTVQITELQTPTLAIWGAHDTWVPLERVQSLLDMNPAIELHVLPQSAHNPMETHLQDFMTLWLGFLAGLEK